MYYDSFLSVVFTFPKCPRPNTLSNRKSSIDISENLNTLDGKILLGSAGCALLGVGR